MGRLRPIGPATPAADQESHAPDRDPGPRPTRRKPLQPPLPRRPISRKLRPMVEITNHEDLEAWLQDKPREVAVVIAARTALRVQPVLARIFDANFSKQRQNALYLQSHRAMLASAVAAVYPTAEAMAAAFAAFAAADAAATADATPAADAAATFAAATFAAAAADAAARAAAGANADAVWAAVSRDCADVDPENSVALFLRSIWPDGPPAFINRTETPVGPQRAAPHWSFWHRWYASMRDGHPLNWDLQRDIAVIPDEGWEKGPEHIAELIAGIEARYPQTLPDEKLEPLPKPPEQDVLLPINFVDGKFDVEPSHFSEVDIEDRIRQAAHQRLRDAAEGLARASGNYHPRLASRARELFNRLDRPLSDLDPLEIHFDLEDLRGIYERRLEFEGEDRLETEEVAALEQIGRFGPGLVRGNTEVEAFEDRLKLEAGQMPSEQTVAAETQIVRSIAEAEDLAGENLRSMSGGVANAEEGSRKGFARRILSKNTLVAVGTFCALAIANKVAGDSGAAGLSWLWQQSEAARVIAVEQGASFVAWFDAVLVEVREYLATTLGSVPEIRPLRRSRGRD